MADEEHPDEYNLRSFEIVPPNNPDRSPDIHGLLLMSWENETATWWMTNEELKRRHDRIARMLNLPTA